MFLADCVWDCFASWLTFPSLSSKAVSFSQHDVHPTLTLLDRGFEGCKSSENISSPVCSFLCWSRLVFWWGWDDREPLEKKVKKKAVVRFIVLARRKHLLTALSYSSSSQDVFKNRKDLKLASGHLVSELFCNLQHLSIIFNTQKGRRRTEASHEHILVSWLVYHRTV